MKNPKLIVKPFAKNGQKNVIPENYETSMESNQATWDQGFGQITMLPVAAGGLPPKGQDFNGIFNQISENIVYLSQGGRFKFSAEYAEAIGGYPKGAILQSDDEKKEYLSLIDNNKVDFNTASDISASWKLVNTDDLLSQIASKQPKGDYATKTELNSGLAGKQPVGDYATKTDVGLKLDKTAVVQTTGSSTTSVMSQKSVTDELKNKASNADLIDGLNKKFDKTGGVLTGNDNVITMRNSGSNRANFIQGENNQENAEWMVGRLGLGPDVSLYSAVHGLSIALRSDGAYVNNDKIMVGVASLLDDRGYIKFGDSGLILQWGLTPNPIGGESVDLSFPIPFPTKCLGGVITPTGSSGDAGFLTSWFHILSRSGFRLTNARTGTTVKYSFYWFDF